MTSKHYRWQTRWRVDLDARRALHDSGLIVQFSTPEGRAHAVDDPELVARLTQQHGPHNIGPMLARWLREAGQLYREAQHAPE